MRLRKVCPVLSSVDISSNYLRGPSCLPTREAGCEGGRGPSTGPQSQIRTMTPAAPFRAPADQLRAPHGYNLVGKPLKHKSESKPSELSTNGCESPWRDEGAGTERGNAVPWSSGWVRVRPAGIPKPSGAPGNPLQVGVGQGAGRGVGPPGAQVPPTQSLRPQSSANFLPEFAASLTKEYKQHKAGFLFVSDQLRHFFLYLLNRQAETDER